MRGQTVVLITLLLIPTFIPGLSSPVYGHTFNEGQSPGSFSLHEVTGQVAHQEGVVIWRVFPDFDTEFVSLFNCGEQPVDLVNWSLSDGEGSISILDHLVLEEKGSLSFCSNITIFSQISDGRPAIALDNRSLSVEGRFILANGGDEVILRDDRRRAVDVFTYGDSEYTDVGWFGTPFQKIPRGEMAERPGFETFQDSNTSRDWCLSVPGRTNLHPISCHASVEPFSFPENGKEYILRELDFASRSVSISMYKLSDKEVLQSIAECCRRGVEVRILLEGSPVGGFSESYLAGLQSLIDSGCQIYLLKSWEGYKRYDYLHCKIAVIDGYRCLITSENWATASFNNNRGWGAAVESRELASHFTAIIEQDLSKESPDSVLLEGDTPGSVQRATSQEKVVPVNSTRRLPAEVSTVVSPDFSAETISRLIEDADRRILIQQFYCDPLWLNSSSLLSDLLAAADRGVEVKLLLDSTWFNMKGSKNNSEVVETLNGRGEAAGVDFEARLISDYHPFDMLHNKGMIVDDSVIISSVNWCNASLEQNRELGVCIESRAVASYYSRLFVQDWAEDPIPPSLEINFWNASEHGLVWLDASNSSDNQGIRSYLWDVGADGTFDYRGSQRLISLPSGSHHIILSVRDLANNTAQKRFQVTIFENEEGGPHYLMYAPAVLLGTAVTYWQIRKKIKSC